MAQADDSSTPAPTVHPGGRPGPLSGIRVVEFAGIGPAPWCGMMLGDMGADVVRVDRLTPSGLGVPKPLKYDLLNRSKRSIALDLKHPDGIACALDLIARADMLVEGFRPGTMERLGLGPEPALAANPKLVYGRVTGWGQEGPIAHAAGHDLNYIALTGVLHAIGRAGQAPTPPLNLVGDFGGGGLYLAFGMMCALTEARLSGRGQVVDAAMVDGAASLAMGFFGMYAAGLHSDQRGSNVLDSGAPYYEVYECADGRYVCVAPIEAKFREVLLAALGIDAASFPRADDRAGWPRGKAMLAETFRTRTRDDWSALLEGTDACFSPVLTAAEAPAHPHNRARGAFVEVDGVVQPAPGPRFSRTAPGLPMAPRPVGIDGPTALADWGVPAGRVEALLAGGIMATQSR